MGILPLHKRFLYTHSLPILLPCKISYKFIFSKKNLTVNLLQKELFHQYFVSKGDIYNLTVSQQKPYIEAHAEEVKYVLYVLDVNKTWKFKYQQDIYFYLDWRHILAGELVQQAATQVQPRHRLPKGRLALGGAHPTAAFCGVGRVVRRDMWWPIHKSCSLRGWPLSKRLCCWWWGQFYFERNNFFSLHLIKGI